MKTSMKGLRKMDPAMQQRLADANARYQRVVTGTDRPAPGTYQMQLRSATFRESNKGKWMIRWTFVLLDGANAGEECSDISALESESFVPMRLCIQRVEQLGFAPPADLFGYQELCPKMTQAAPIVLADLSHSDQYDRIKITQLLAATSAVAAVTAPAAPAAVPPTAVPVAAAPPPTPVAAAAPPPTAGAPPAVGDTVQCKTAEDDGTFTIGIVDEIAPNGVISVGINETEAFDTTPDDLVVTARAAVPAPVQPAPTAPAAPAAAPVPVTPAPVAATPAAPMLTTPPADPQLEALVVMAKSYGVEDINDISTREEVIAALNENVWYADLVEPADAALLTSVGVPIAPAQVAAPIATPAPAPAAPVPAAPARTVTKKKKKKKKTAKRKKKS